MALRAGEGDFGGPIAGHLRVNGRAILSGGGGSKNFSDAVHDHAWHVRRQFKCNVTHINKLSVGIAEFDENVIAGCQQRIALAEKTGGQIVDFDSGKRPGGNLADGRRFMRQTGVSDAAADSQDKQDRERVKKIERPSCAGLLFVRWRCVPHRQMIFRSRAPGKPESLSFPFLE